ncbi:olfactory receptor 5V1-like [Pleurodeles waltl]|uniref:olfactory receptor 5V1-like n=1 Tax=Pleurodeles waltl TaxID=8319 RepID=UPI003709A838
MEAENLTRADIFLIVGFSDLTQLQIPLFVIFLMLYTATLFGNAFVMAIVYSNSQLHTPMYFFLSNLSFIDICYTSNIFPQMLAHFFQKGASISFTECLIQAYVFMAMVSLEFILLAVMAYDRYVAICNPLRYTTIMNRVLCIKLASGTWLVGFMDPVPHTILISGLSFCASHEINHFFCDVTALLKLSCTNTHTIESMTYIVVAFLPIISFLLIITSYINIISAILKIQSVEGRQKAFSTCASHLTVVILFYGCVCITYARPTTTYLMQDNKIMSLSYTVFTPLCNPIIYCLRNKEFKNSLRLAKIRMLL